LNPPPFDPPNTTICYFDAIESWEMSPTFMNDEFDIFISFKSNSMIAL
jgi:hypothetical protein